MYITLCILPSNPLFIYKFACLRRCSAKCKMPVPGARLHLPRPLSSCLALVGVSATPFKLLRKLASPCHDQGDAFFLP
jgi:hypothetical protein